MHGVCGSKNSLKGYFLHSFSIKMIKNTSTETFWLSIAFLKVFTFGAFLTNSDNLIHTGGILLESENFLILARNLSIEFLVRVVLENLKKVCYFRIVSIINDLVICIKSPLTLLAFNEISDTARNLPA